MGSRSPVRIHPRGKQQYERTSSNHAKTMARKGRWVAGGRIPSPLLSLCSLTSGCVLLAADGSIAEHGGRGMLEGLYPEIPAGESHTATSITGLPTEFGTMSGHFEVMVMERKMDLWVMGTEQFKARCEWCGLSMDGRPVWTEASRNWPEDVS